MPRFKRKFVRRKRRFIKKKSSLLTKFKPNSVRTYTCVFEGRNNVSTAGASIVSQYPMNYPVYFINNAGTWGLMGIVPANLTKCMLLFGEYKVLKMQLIYKSTYIDTTSNVAPFVDDMIYLVNDKDNLTTALTELDATADGLIPKSINLTGKDIIQSFTNPSKGRWIPTPQSATSPTAAAGVNALTQYGNNYYGIKLLVPNIAPNVQTIVMVRWIVTFRGLRETAP